MKRHILLGGRAFVGDIDLVALVLTGEDCGNYILTVPHIPSAARDPMEVLFGNTAQNADRTKSFGGVLKNVATGQTRLFTVDLPDQAREAGGIAPPATYEFRT